MKASKGIFSLVLIAILICTTTFAQIILYHLKSDYQRTSLYLEGIQQRILCRSIFTWAVENVNYFDHFQIEHKLPPNDKVCIIEGNNTQSTDKMFAKVNVKVTSNNKEQRLTQLFFLPNKQFKNYGEQYMFISKYALSGTEYLSNDILYTSGGSFPMPQIEFLSTEGHTSFDMTLLHENGFTNSFYYLPQSTTLTYLSTAKTTNGNELIASKVNLTFQKNFKAPGRLVVIANGSVTLEDYVNLGKVLIIAKGNVNLGKNCKINGVIFSGGSIKISGNGTYSHDASVVADFASTIFIV
ncbi:MAG: hypothetical protein MJ050_07585 [Phascolarctobacterium sp.]|nr:hypothetical protein [Phascolarctobacterium sp.]